ncbi:MULTISPECIES: TetR/AcrR family transcriptional regulator [unclassified Streptomyces]|uniref:TetR/AcrR family transcriptional regulator n=1 Tax=unclassified Streptomyces TaxID=2593676 RepID=UPI001F04710F|nr:MULTISPECIES: TetR/AcrR family transcriptional regulator C-terminal domain-containing protein [unclassified Streptomyces]MCH0565883.1 TetR/AcrR family transcriptional regulator C-terminal domain-containing protein [Streptomyces sp. MUM 2J]MCH0569048.1 TetR/AcrR family transcriptional regulator C-terminal domain-containing protein [Streptomyces sp. MUM 136J]
MPHSSAPRKPRGRPPRISREEVVATARRIVDADGVDRLTMRRLATEIGSTPMALYHHVRNKEELLVLLLDDYAARTLHRPDLPAHPRERVVAAAAAIHDALVACPWIVEVLTADDLMSTSALWFVEQIVDGLVACGLTPEKAVHGYRAIWYYTAGEMVVRTTAARRRTDEARPTYRERVFAALDPGELPRLAQVADRWAPLTAEDTYLDGLRALVDGLLTTR